MDSPRGRIVLMKEVLEGNLRPEQAAPFVDRCLGCVACQPACPSGVEYGNLLSSYRAVTHDQVPRKFLLRVREFLVHQTVPFPGRFRIAVHLGKIVAPFSFLMPQTLRPMLELAPKKIPKAIRLPEFSPAVGVRKGQVGLLAGCAQQVLAPEINLATMRVLNHVGFDVIVPKKQSCCGALDWHDGRLETTRRMAAGNFERFPADVETIITNAAGCGSAINDYQVIFQETEMLEKARQFSNKVIDISKFLASQPMPPGRFDLPTRIAYHDACHLAHAQGIRAQPRHLLEQIDNVELVPLVESERCCGSAGTYNLQQPEIAKRLGKLKVQTVLDSNCQIVAAGNIGCLIQIRKYLQARNSPIRALHPIEILEQAIGCARESPCKLDASKYRHES
jgi:glycolate oxidase iron-sulfur subunit